MTMAVDKSMTPVDFEVIDDTVMIFDDEDLANTGSLGTDTVGADEPTVTQLEDGGMEFDFGGERPDVMAALLNAEGSLVGSHTMNLAEYMTENDLRLVASDLLEKYEADLSSRSDWEKAYRDGMDLLGLKFEERTEPWEGASGVYHPMLAEAVVRFQSQTIGEILPAKGPVKTAIVGRYSKEKDDQAHRVQNYMNYVIMHQMKEYRRETDRLLWSLPIAGSAFRKVYIDPVFKRPSAVFIPAEDIIVSNAESSIETAERITHRMRKSENEVRKLQVSGFYRDVEVPSPSPAQDAIDEKKQELQGTSDVLLTSDARHSILEMHVDLDLPGFEDDVALPYIVSIDKSSSTVLSIYRNWDETDENREREQYFAHYEFVPGFGFYAFGLIHLIGSLVKGSTSILRQLIDAGTLSNLPGGLKARGMRIKGDETPIMPGEWRDVDLPSGQLRDNIFPLPYNEPSGTLFNLLGMIVQDGRQFASMADMKVSDMNNEAPVGTTLAVMERALKIQTAIQQRIHDSLRTEFTILARIIRDFTTPEYPYETEEGEGIKGEDFDDRVDVIPVSDPNASTFSQRIMQFQAALQLAAQAPQLYDLKLLHRKIVDALGIQEADRIVPTEEDVAPVDPVIENMNILNVKPVKAFEYQDHQAHIRVHMAFRNDPKLQQDIQNSPMGAAVGGAVDAHLREHLAFQYRAEIERELGAELPGIDEPIPEDIEQRLSSMIADAADQLLGTKQAMAQAEQNAALQQDPIIQAKQQELQIKGQEVERKKAADMARQQIEQAKLQTRTQLEQTKLQTKTQLEQDKMRSDEQIEREKIAQRDREAQLEAQTEQQYHDSKNTLEGIKLGVSIAKESADDGESK